MRAAFLKYLLPLLFFLGGSASSYGHSLQDCSNLYRAEGDLHVSNELTSEHQDLDPLRDQEGYKAGSPKKKDREQEHRSFFLLEEDDDDKVKHHQKLAPHREPLKELHPTDKKTEKSASKALPFKTSSHRWHLIIEVLRN